MSASKTIAFVDDDTDFLEAQAAFFRKRGYVVVCAESEDDAMRMLGEAAPDIIFLDLMMDHYDSGFNLGHRIRQQAHLAQVPIVMLSGVAGATGRTFHDDQHGLHAWPEIDQFVDKPVTGRQLLRIVEERLGVVAQDG